MYLFTGGGANLLRPYLEEMFEDNKEYIRFSETAKWDNCLSFILNYLFKISANREQIFNTLCNEFEKKLTNNDKSLDFSVMDNMKSLVANI